MAFEFEIRDWAACAPGLETRQSWLDWSELPHLPDGDEVAAVAGMAPMLRRRLGPLGRVALHALRGCQGEVGIMPLVFASRHGETSRAWQMLDGLAVGEPVSPASFALSVHNAIGALHAIDAGDTANLQALSAGTETVEAALMEAAGLLADGNDEVVLVHYEAPLAPAFASFADEPQCLYAWAWRIGRPVSGQRKFSLSWDATVPAKAGPWPLLPRGLEVLRFMIGDERELIHHGRGCTWTWKSHG